MILKLNGKLFQRQGANCKLRAGLIIRRQECCSMPSLFLNLFCFWVLKGKVVEEVIF